jgi:nucleotide-binding universal stress UspA family protein
MAYKNLLVYVDDHESNPGCIQAAIDLTRAHDAHLTGLYVSVEPVLPAAMRAEVAPDLLEILRDQARERADAAVARFTEAAKMGGVSADCRSTHGPATSLPDVIGLHARYADLAILGQDGPEGSANGDGHLAEDVR